VVSPVDIAAVDAKYPGVDGAKTFRQWHGDEIEYRYAHRAAKQSRI